MSASVPAFVRDFRVIAALLDSMGADLFGGEPQFLDAHSLDAFSTQQPFAEGLPYFSSNRPLIVGRIDSPATAMSVGVALSEYFPLEHTVVLFREADEADLKSGIAVAQLPLKELGRKSVAQDCYAMVLPVDTLDQSRSPLGLHALVASLRSPNGCPWDRAQTHASIRAAVIEEAYEVADAIDEGDFEHLAEELGDLALQVALHAQIALEAGEFTPADVYGLINRKLVRRHPHVFGAVKADTPGDVVRTWESVKAEEREAAGKPMESSDPFDRLPRSMPVMTRVASVFEREAAPATSHSIGEDALGDQLLDAIGQLIASGFNPEAALERAYRRRVTANLANQ